MQYKMSYAREQQVPPAAAHHRQQQQAGKPVKPSRSQIAPEAHFDPNELSRRLYLVLADQKEHAERSRRARAAAEASSSSRSKENHHTGAAAASSGRRNGGSTVAAGAPPARSSQEGQRSSSTTSRSSKPQEKASAADLITELRRSKSRKTPPPTKPGEPAAEYHHVPKEAAKQFARTTTSEVMRGTVREHSSGLVHQLSKRALKLQQGNQPPVSLDRTQLQRAPRIPEEVLSPVERAREQQQNGHTFESELSRILPESHPYHQRTAAAAAAARRNSTGNAEQHYDVMEKIQDNRRSLILMEPLLDMVAEDVVMAATITTTPPPNEHQQEAPGLPAHEHRVDWTQSDESKHASRPKLMLPPLLRKADSIWTLKGRLGGHKAAAAAAPATIQEHPTEDTTKSGSSPLSPTNPKSPKSPSSKTGGFFAKFKRQPPTPL
ncbi:hypothetical protein QBC46DRAFT_69 [Diplogelasinospora grovesii]|uniref:Uncharacterized protein n=1 Tax=Diplogelasinospora grovesii TaxID=303347 RepID=A0AAN6NHW6_9PEZI|nr:hypothetical protein QBC46DRAFT_69 [Diplogelasinospora grovesii]